MSSHQRRAADDEVDEQLGAADELAVAHLQLQRLAAVRALGAHRAVRVQGGRDPEPVPGAVREPRAAAGRDPVGRLDGRDGFSIRISVVPASRTSVWASWRRR